MTISDLTGELTVTTRDKEAARWRRDYSFRNPTDNTTEGTIPYALSETAADFIMPVYRDVQAIADAQDPEKISGAQLTKQAEADGVFKLAASGSSGAVLITASAGGTHIFRGDELTYDGLRYRCAATNTYLDDDPCPVEAIDTGVATNIAAGSVMRWSSPRPGCASTAVVIEQTDGTGLSGGRPEETEDEYRARWLLEKRQRAAAGNDAEIQRLAEDSKSTGVVVQKAFTIPAILGPGTTCLAVLLKPASVGASRLPNPTQRAAVLAHVISKLPGDDGVFMATVAADPTDVTVKIAWHPDATGWADAVPWPGYYANPGQALLIAAATDATHFQIASQSGSYVGLTEPSAGKTLAVYDQAKATFLRKRILSVAGFGPWTIVCDTANGVSDTSYVPIAGQRVMPWSDSLQTLVEPLQSYFGSLGPGEQVATFFDEGVRQRRQPESPKEWPSVLTTKGLENAVDIASTFDTAIAEPALPRATTVGTPGAISYLITLRRIAAFPL